MTKLNQDSFPAAATLPNGRVLSGDRNSFPASMRLLDDGDVL